MKLTWTQDLATGFDSIDQDHRVMLKKIAELLPATKTENAPFELDKILSAIEEYAFHHFHEEEKLMLESHYSGAYTHIAEHSRLKGYLASLKNDIAHHGPDPDVVEVSSRLLANSIIEHIKHCDGPLIAHLKIFHQHPESALVQPVA